LSKGKSKRSDGKHENKLLHGLINESDFGKQ
jgi:hypothetical protein